MRVGGDSGEKSAINSREKPPPKAEGTTKWRLARIHTQGERAKRNGAAEKKS